METRIDHIVGGIYRISTMTETYGITFNQFLIDDERPTLVHTGDDFLYENIRNAIREVLDPATLANLVLLHWEGDENGGMGRFMGEAPTAELVGSALSIQLNAASFGVDTVRVRSFMDGERLELGRHTLRVLETPHVHHWDSMMLFEEATGSLFPSDLYLQPGDQPPVTSDNLSAAMIEVYRGIGIFAHENPVRTVVDRIEELDPAWIHAMHGASLKGEALHYYNRALRAEEFAYNGLLLGRDINAVAAAAA
jgi:flavorubredoxin